MWIPPIIWSYVQVILSTIFSLNIERVILEGSLGEKVSLSWLTSPYLELREKWKCIECRGLNNSRFGVSYSNFSFLTTTFWKVSIDKYGKTPNFFRRTTFYSNFQNPSENPGMYREIQNLDQNFSLKSWNCRKTSPSLKALGWWPLNHWDTLSTYHTCPKIWNSLF